MASRQREFVNRVYNEARSAGLPDAQARLAASQAALETDYGRSSVGNNYFGIKAGKSWNGPSVSANTWEDYGNGPVNERANFRSYSDPTQSFNDWQSVVGRRWGGALTAPTLSDAVESLNYGKPGGYASDRGYGSKIRYIDRNFGPDAYANSIPQGNIPTPTAAPDIQSILSGTPSPVNNSILGTAPVASVQRTALAAPQAAGFDMGRFGDPTFDASRFGDPAATSQTTTNGLRRALLDQQLAAGELPSLSNPAYAAMAGQPTVQQPSIANATVQAPPQKSITNSLLSAPEQRAVAAQRAYLEQQPLNAKSPFTKQGIEKALGTVAGSLLGGFTLGPVGALLGGFAGNKITNSLLTNQYPEAPKSKSRGDGGLTDYGRSVQNSSGQFSRALASGGKGLY